MQVPSLLAALQERQAARARRHRPAAQPAAARRAAIADTLPGYELTGTEWLVAPAGTPRDILAKLNAAVTAILAIAGDEGSLGGQGRRIHPRTPERFAESSGRTTRRLRK